MKSTNTSGFRIIQQQGCELLFDPQRLSELLSYNVGQNADTDGVGQMDEVDARFLINAVFKQSSDTEKVATGGRGQAWFMRFAAAEVVLRAYQRGGLVARFNRQTYLGFNSQHSRAFKEWFLLQQMLELGLPVPRPIAASICRWPVSFSPLYQARILLEKIVDSQTLDHLLSQQTLADEQWRAIGQCIAQFHHHGVYHADLNANNILLTQDKVHLIDFDKSSIRSGHSANQPAQWPQENLQRLRRSLLKQQALHKHYHFSESGWQELLMSYKTERGNQF